MNLKKRNFTPKRKDIFLISLFLSSCFSFQTRTNLVLVKFFCNAAVRRFSKTFRKFARKRLWWKQFFKKFNLLKVNPSKDVFLSIFWTHFCDCFQTLNRNACGCFQTLNRNAFLWVITLFGANTPESSKICQKVEAFSYLMSQNA